MFGQKFGRKLGKKAAQNRGEFLKREQKLERPVAPAMPCKIPPNSIKKVSAKPDIASEKMSKRVYGCIVEPQESSRQRVESSQHKNHEDHIRGKRIFSMSHHDLVHKFIPMPQAMKIPDAKAAVDKEWKMLETIPAWNLEKSEEQKKRFLWQHKERDKKRKSTLLH